MTLTKKPIPTFACEEEARAFWATADSAEYVDWRSTEREAMPNLKPTLKTISLRLPVILLEELKLLANRRDVPYQSLLKRYLAERVHDELRSQP